MNKQTQQKDKYQNIVKEIKEKTYKKMIIYGIVGTILTFIGGMTWLYLITEEQNFKENQEIIAIIISLVVFALGVQLIKRIRILRYDLNRRIHKIEEIRLDSILKEYEKSPIVEVEETTPAEEFNLHYRKKYLLTKNEWGFYKSLKPIADELQLTVLSKIRVADLVEPIPNKNQSEWQTYFNKINRKHIDFALAKPENLQIMLLIELDDNSHDAHQKQRDEFIETLYTQTGYNFIRVRGTGELKTKIENALKEEKTKETKEEENKKPPMIIKKLDP